MTEREVSPVRRFLTAPLLHFVLLGAVLVVLYLQFGSPGEPDRKTIVVSAQQIELLSSMWERQWRRPPLH